MSTPLSPATREEVRHFLQHTSGLDAEQTERAMLLLCHFLGQLLARCRYALEQHDFKQLAEQGQILKETLQQAGLERWARVTQPMMVQAVPRVAGDDAGAVALIDLLQRLQQGLARLLAASPGQTAGKEAGGAGEGLDKAGTGQAQTQTDASPPASGHAKRILILDDDPFVCSMAASMLEYLGYLPVSVCTGKEALLMYRQALDTDEPFALVIMDANLSGGEMQGAEAVRELRRLDGRVRLLICSGDQNAPLMSGYASYGFQGSLAKPYTVNSMARAVAQALQTAAG